MQRENPAALTIPLASRPAGAPPAGESPAAAPATIKVAPGAALRKIASLGDLPPYSEVLSAAGGKFSLREHLQFGIAALLTGVREATILVTEAESAGTNRTELARRLTTAGLKIANTFLVEPGILHAVVDGTKDAGDSGLKNEMRRDFQALVEKAIRLNVSDIHIVGKAEMAEVRMRRNGRLVLYTEWSRKYMLLFIHAVHFMADDDGKEVAFSDKEGQSMAASLRLADGSEVSLRIQTLPVVPSNLKIVMRVLHSGKQARARSLAELGYAHDHISMFEAMLSRPSGVVVVAGVTGSGKSTTLHTCMTNLAAAETGASLYTVEDPVESLIKGVEQVPVVRSKEARGTNANPFAKTLRDLMRADPDIVMVGEVRDPESAVCLTNMVQTGHLVLTTVHARSALDVVPRFKNLGMLPDDFCAPGFIAGLVFQTLVPLLCPGCKRPYDEHAQMIRPGIHERIRALPGIDAAELAVQGPGCVACDGLGIIGRTVCAEILLPDDGILEMLRAGRYKDAKDHWRSRKAKRAAGPLFSMAGVSALEHAIQKMRAGEVSCEDVESCLGQLTGEPSSAMQVLDAFADFEDS